MSNELQEARPVVEALSKLLESPKWRIVHDSANDRYAIVFGKDADSIDEIGSAAVTSLRELE